MPEHATDPATATLSTSCASCMNDQRGNAYEVECRAGEQTVRFQCPACQRMWEVTKRREVDVVLQQSTQPNL
jgi:hypothetical protein